MRYRLLHPTERQEHFKKLGMTQIQAAEKMAITELRVSDLMRGKIELFSLEALVDMISAAGLQVEFKVEKKSSGGSKDKSHTRPLKKAA